MGLCFIFKQYLYNENYENMKILHASLLVRVGFEDFEHILSAIFN